MNLEFRKEDDGWYWLLIDLDHNRIPRATIDRGPFPTMMEASRDFREAIQELI